MNPSARIVLHPLFRCAHLARSIVTLVHLNKTRPLHAHVRARCPTSPRAPRRALTRTGNRRWVAYFIDMASSPSQVSSALLTLHARLPARLDRVVSAWAIFVRSPLFGVRNDPPCLSMFLLRLVV
jgi:hypothetical protein